MTRSGRRWSIAALVAVALPLFCAGEANAQLGALVSPGRLHKTHASLEGVANCLQCHSKGQQVDAHKCLSCHKPVAERIARKKGVHRDVTTDCVKCHVEHAGADAELRPFDQKAFDHARDAGWPLDGLHAPLAANCAACHKTRSFLAAAGTTCVSCHTDTHKGSLGAECSKCHSTGLKFAAAATTAFDHGRTRFPLAGGHLKATCASCHVNKQYKGIAFQSCANCHKDPHAGKLGPTCRSCHTEAAWRTSKVDHARTAFPLRGKHATVECAKCHLKPAALAKVRFDTCAACHTDPHRGTFRQDCGACHTEVTFKKGAFDHATTRFALVDKHAGLGCVACHKTSRPAANDFKGLKTTCDSCHSDVHRGELGLACEKCHSARTWEVKTFTHANPRAFFGGLHAPLACAQCHTATMQPTRSTAAIPALRVGFATTSATCVACHKDVHLGQFASTCDTCHSVVTPRFAVAAFDHKLTKFPLTGKHAPAACDACHKVETGAFPAGHGTARRLKGVDTACAACHQDPHKGQLDRACQTCHGTQTFALPAYTHKNARALRAFFAGRHTSATCVSCHKPLSTPASATQAVSYTVSTTCTNCHADVHRGALGPACDSCHRP